MSLKAIIFCKVEHKAMVSVLNELQSIPEIKKVFSLTGEYDIIAQAEVENSEELYEVFAKNVDTILGIINTNTHIVMKSFEK
ncbi:MAG: Lrp/AsnC family transcriptional regulator [Promethearchaeota archaeon]|nr:MAG: Lrp/AsnC family transcriptional regulator [Candidatus Lokiarchaeota archaeon]